MISVMGRSLSQSLCFLRRPRNLTKSLFYFWPINCQKLSSRSCSEQQRTEGDLNYSSNFCPFLISIYLDLVSSWHFIFGDEKMIFRSQNHFVVSPKRIIRHKPDLYCYQKCEEVWAKDHLISKQNFLFSFEPKIEQNYVSISALRFLNG